MADKLKTVRNRLVELGNKKINLANPVKGFQSLLVELNNLVVLIDTLDQPVKKKAKDAKVTKNKDEEII